MKHYNFLQKICLILLLSSILVFGSMAVSAETVEGVPYTSYSYWDINGTKTAVKQKEVFNVEKKITGQLLGIGDFSELQYIFSTKDNLYILDSGNGRILVLDTEYRVINQIKDITYNGEAIDFKGAKGLFVDDSGIYIADTDHERIIHMRGNVIEHIISKPDDPSIPSTFAFAPSKIVRDKNGYIYLLCDGSYYGMMVFSDTYEFFGFFGANNVEKTFGGAIKEAVLSLFETEAKKSASLKSLPFSLLDLCLDSNGFIAAINGETVGQLRRFGFSGTNTLIKKQDFSNASSDSYNFADNPVMYRDKTNGYQVFYQSKFRAITADKDGFYYLLDDTSGRIFVYDNNCSCITVFGGGRQNGSQLGTFVSPSSIAVLNDNLFVTDFSTNEITVFTKTDFGATLMNADAMTIKNEYDSAKPLWEKVLNEDSACQLAYKGLTKYYIKHKKYNEAMNYAEKGQSKELYAEAFENVRNDFIMNNFIWISLITVALIGVFIAFIIVSRRKQLVIIKNNKIRTALRMSIHPIESLQNIKYKNHGSWLIPTVYLGLFYISSALMNLKTGFMYSTVDLSNFNSILLLLGTIGVVILWTLSNWLVCILFDGKGKIKDIYCSSCYSLTPLIIYNFAFVLLSRIIIPGTGSFLNLLNSICYGLIVVFLLLTITIVHEFSFFKAIITAGVTVIGMAIVAFVLFSMLTLWQDMLAFLIGLFNEATLR